jgi:hypothetical protein
MSAHEPPVRLRIGTLRVTAASAAEARQLAEALSEALERAWLRPAPPPGATTQAAGRESTRPGRGRADTVADEVVLAARRALDQRALDRRARDRRALGRPGPAADEAGGAAS